MKSGVCLFQAEKKVVEENKREEGDLGGLMTETIFFLGAEIHHNYVFSLLL